MGGFFDALTTTHARLLGFRAGYTALTLAADNGHAEIAKLLIEKGADPNPANKKGEWWHHHV